MKVGRDRIEKDPGQTSAGGHAARLHEIRRVPQCAAGAHLARERKASCCLPSRGIRMQGEAHGVVWRLPAYNVVHNILTNPIYAGAYAFGRTGSRVSVVEGRKRIRRGVHKPMTEWDVLHQGSSRGLHHLGRVRAQPQSNRRQCDRHEPAPSPAARPAKASYCYRGCCDAGIAVANCTSTTAASSAAITATARARTTAPSAASR